MWVSVPLEQEAQVVCELPTSYLSGVFFRAGHIAFFIPSEAEARNQFSMHFLLCGCLCWCLFALTSLIQRCRRNGGGAVSSFWEYLSIWSNCVIWNSESCQTVNLICWERGKSWAGLSFFGNLQSSCWIDPAAAGQAQTDCNPSELHRFLAYAGKRQGQQLWGSSQLMGLIQHQLLMSSGRKLARG